MESGNRDPVGSEGALRQRGKMAYEKTKSTSWNTVFTHPAFRHTYRIAVDNPKNLS